MEEWGVGILHLGNCAEQLENNLKPSIVKEVLHIRFTRLVSLRLHQNELSSVEALALVYMPHL